MLFVRTVYIILTQLKLLTFSDILVPLVTQVVGTVGEMMAVNIVKDIMLMAKKLDCGVYGGQRSNPFGGAIYKL